MIGDSSKFMLPDVTALQNKDFYTMGVYTVMSIAQGGCGLPFLAGPVFNYLIGSGECTGIMVDDCEMPEGLLKLVVKKIREAENTDDLKRCFEIDDAVPLLYDTGYTKSINDLRLIDKSAIIMALIDYHLMVKVKAEMDQFKDGLVTLGFLRFLVSMPKEWESYFLTPHRKVNAESIKNLLIPEFSDISENLREAEEKTCLYFANFLQECEDGTTDCDITDVLKFCTGADDIPSCGFDDIYPTLSFDYSAALPTASTCEVQLRLPSKYSSYERFKEAMLLGINGHNGFGVV